MNSIVKRYECYYLSDQGWKNDALKKVTTDGDFVLYSDCEQTITVLETINTAFEKTLRDLSATNNKLEADNTRLKKLLKDILIWHTGDYDAGGDCEMVFPETAIRKEIKT